MPDLGQSVSRPFDPTPVVCPVCLRERRSQRTEYDFRCNWFECRIHGPVLTDEFIVDHLDGVRP